MAAFGRWLHQAQATGPTLVVLGVVSILDTGQLQGWIARGAEASTPLLVAALVLFISGIWLSEWTES